MADRDRPHLFLPEPPQAEPFAPVGGGGDRTKPDFPRDRASHGQALQQQFEQAVQAPRQDIEAAGTYVSFESFPGLTLALESLDPQRDGEPSLVAVKEQVCPAGTAQVATVYIPDGASAEPPEDEDPGTAQVATVYIPDGKRDYFLKRLSEYVRTAGDDKAKHAALVEGIAGIRRATIRELWTDPDNLFPDSTEASVWWEVWLQRDGGREQERLREFVKRHRLLAGQHYLGFHDRTVALVRATVDQLALGLESLDDLAELRRPHEVASLLTDLAPLEQKEWVEVLRSRLKVADSDSPVVCVLDTGIQGSHPLLRDSLAETDVHVAEAGWQKEPTRPHGTEMAGLALYSDLHQAVITEHEVRLDHRLESVKILPDCGQNDPDVYGAITARAVDRPEIQAPDRSRVFMLAVTAPQDEPDDPESQHRACGRPTSWSAAVDSLAFGRAVDDTAPGLTYLDREDPRRPRLLIVSTGNIQPGSMSAVDNHLDRSDLSPVEDPAQSWNALTVGAYSQRDEMAEAPTGFERYRPLAPRGELSPFSRTSVLHDDDWPFKPEVVADGGNAAASPDGNSVDTPPNLGVLTTRMVHPGSGFFTMTNATSAATAQVAAMAASISAAYPKLRPETVRALIVHSARWTPAMQARFDDRRATKGDLANLVRRYGMGVPDLDRALRSATDALTLVGEGRIRPFEPDGQSGRRIREMNLHELPWPTEQLESLGETKVSMRVTLSYFIEPNPSSRGWTGRYVYPSHGLRFATKRPDENTLRFRQRINMRAREETTDEVKASRPRTEKGWLLGSKQHCKPGSLHTDIWTGPAVNLASKGVIAVYPVAGWWKHRPKWDQSEQGVDYSLVVSIEAPDVGIDLWTPVFEQIQALVPIVT
ncbi:MAG: S8 family peptidase [Actinomycetia bacterium]|nr:S8 family peptidase [Actinomycetes bacterium]